MVTNSLLAWPHMVKPPAIFADAFQIQQMKNPEFSSIVHAFKEPLPLRRPLDEAYRSQDAAAEYDARHKRSFTRRWVTRREVASVSRLLKNTRKGAAIFDGACGTGRISFALRQRGWRLVSMDASKDMIKKGLEAKSFNQNQVINGSIYQIPLTDQCVDGAVCIRFFHHLNEKELRLNALKELRRVSRGPVVVSIWSGINFQSFRRALKTKRGRRPSQRYTIPLRTFRDEAESVGLVLTQHLYLYRFISETVYLLFEPAP